MSSGWDPDPTIDKGERLARQAFEYAYEQQLVREPDGPAVVTAPVRSRLRQFLTGGLGLWLLLMAPGLVAFAVFRFVPVDSPVRREIAPLVPVLPVVPATFWFIARGHYLALTLVAITAAVLVLGVTSEWFLLTGMGILCSFAVAYSANSRALGGLAILATVFSYWRVLFFSESSTETPGERFLVTFAFVPLGLFLLGIGELQRTTKRTQSLNATFSIFGLVTLSAAMFLLASGWIYVGATPKRCGMFECGLLPFLIQLPVAFGATIVTLIALVQVWRIRGDNGRVSLTLAAGMLGMLLSYLVPLFQLDPLFQPGVGRENSLYYSLVLLALIIWAILHGVLTRRGSLATIALVFLLLLTVASSASFLFSRLDLPVAAASTTLVLAVAGYVLGGVWRRLRRTLRAPEGGVVLA